MSAHDEAVEAAARGVWGDAWDELDDDGRRDAIADCRAQVTAYLRHMRAAGFVVTRVPEAQAGNLFWGREGTADASGWNRCRAATLANAVEAPE